MLIRAYGLFWRADEIEWTPGSGNKSTFQLLGRRGAGSALRVADFRNQNGIYVLYGDYGATYVGLASNLGKRLKDHRSDHLAGKWDRFSWFGCANVAMARDKSTGLHPIKQLKRSVGTPGQAIADMEALLIFAIGPSSMKNLKQEKFKKAEEWKQITFHDREKFLAKAATK